MEMSETVQIPAADAKKLLRGLDNINQRIGAAYLPVCDSVPCISVTIVPESM